VCAGPKLIGFIGKLAPLIKIALWSDVVLFFNFVHRFTVCAADTITTTTTTTHHADSTISSSSGPGPGCSARLCTGITLIGLMIL